MNNIDVVYTMWENLHKTGDMDVGQVKQAYDTNNRIS